MRFILSPTLRSHEGDKPARHAVFVLIRVALSNHCHQILHLFISHGRHQPPAFGELPEQGVRNPRRAGCNENAVVRRLVRISGGPVRGNKSDISITQFRKQRARFPRKGAMPLDGNHPVRNLGQHRCLIPRTGADFHHPGVQRNLQHFRHYRHHIGLGDGLSAVDG